MLACWQMTWLRLGTAVITLACASPPREAGLGSARKPVAGREAHEHRHAQVDRQDRPVRQLIAEADEQRGAQIFAARCTPCHGTHGRGDGPLAAKLVTEPRDLTRREVGNLPPEHLYRVVRDGGASVGLSKAMPAWGRKLDDDQIADVLAFVLTLSK
ncbi:MAG: cytochrome c [Deltaproteobacteria bacterium]|nr:cytochrome c [Deltaproteobacteria bacterium]